MPRGYAPSPLIPKHMPVPPTSRVSGGRFCSMANVLPIGNRVKRHADCLTLFNSSLSSFSLRRNDIDGVHARRRRQYLRIVYEKRAACLPAPRTPTLGMGRDDADLWWWHVPCTVCRRMGGNSQWCVAMVP